MKPLFDIVVAHEENNGIGKDNQLIWRIPEDMAFFKNLTSVTNDVTKKNIVIMGRATFQSLPKAYRPLPNRINIVLTQSIQLQLPDTYCVSSVDDALHCSQNLIVSGQAESVFCIGGSQVYHDMIQHPNCRKLYITKLLKSFDCDAFFPTYSATFRLQDSQPKQFSSVQEIPFQLQTWIK